MRAALIQAAAVRVNEALVLRAGEILIAPAEAVRQGTTTFRKSGFRKGENTWEYLTVTQVPTIIEVGVSWPRKIGQVVKVYSAV